MMSLLLSLLILIAPTDSGSVNIPSLTIGQEAPKCYAKQLGGGDFFLSRHVGNRVYPDRKNPIVLSFFTTACIPCRKEIPYIHTLKEEYPNIGVYLVNVGEKPELVETYIRKMNYTLPVLLDRYGMIAKKYRALTTPTLVLISTTGKIHYYKRGFSDGDQELIRRQFRSLADAAGPQKEKTDSAR